MIYRYNKTTTKENNSDFIRLTGDILNPIHYDEAAAQNIQARLGMQQKKGVVLAGAFTQSKLEFMDAIKGYPVSMKISLRTPAIVDEKLEMMFEVEEDKEAKRPEGMNVYNFSIINGGGIISTGQLMTTPNFGFPKDKTEGLEEISEQSSLVLNKDLMDKYCVALGEDFSKYSKKYSNNISSMAIAAFIPAYLIPPIKNAVKEACGKENSKEYMFLSQRIKFVKKDIDKNSHISFYYSQPKVDIRKKGIFCKTRLIAINAINSKKDVIFESEILGLAK